MTWPPDLEMHLADLRLTLAQRRFARGLDQWLRKYRPDQPRAPKGTPEGGQWVVDPHRVPGRRATDGHIRVADITLFGKLMLEWRLGDGSRMCIYDLGSQKWAMLQDATAQIGCYGMLHQSSIFRAGTRLNDNW